jgi:CheY-like chemotaxis protein
MSGAAHIHKLMIVDDHTATRQWLRSAFSTFATEICESRDGNEAVQMYYQERPDWVLMDFEMEPMNGLIATRLITQEFPEARVVVMTSHDERGLREAALNAGAVRFLRKEDLWQVQQIISEFTDPQ